MNKVIVLVAVLVLAGFAAKDMPILYIPLDYHDRGCGYAKNIFGQVYHVEYLDFGNRVEKKKLEGEVKVDPCCYAVGDTVVYHVGDEVIGADASTFQVLGCPSLAYAKDENHVFINDYVMSGVDPQTFQLLEGYGYSKDKYNIYYESEIIHDADRETFSILGDVNSPRDQNKYYGYAKDAKHLYRNGMIEDSSSAEILSDHYRRVGDKILYNSGGAGGTPIELDSVSAETFEVLGFYFAKDKDAIFYGKEVVHNPDVDVESFVELGGGYAKDVNNVYFFHATYDYWLEKLPKADVTTFQYMKGTVDEYAKDKNHVYREGGILENVDAATFEFNGQYFQDKQNCYYLGEVHNCR